jgi:stage III sporulation protein AH
LNAKIWKKNAVLATVILFVCVAVYLNWSYGNDVPQDAGLGADIPKGTSVLSLKDPYETDGAVLGEAGGDTIVSMKTEGESGDYFAVARLTRQQARDSSLGILKQSSENTEASQEARDAALESFNLIATQALKEAQIESLVMAKGFENCVAYISDTGIDIVVSSPEGGLVAEEVSKIKDIVIGETNASVADIVIMEVKG